MDEDITWGFSVHQNRVKVHLALTQIIQRKVMDNKLIYHKLGDFDIADPSSKQDPCS